MIRVAPCIVVKSPLCTLCCIVHTANIHGEQIVYQVVDYNRFKIVENNKTSTSKSYCDRVREVIVHERFQL